MTFIFISSVRLHAGSTELLRRDGFGARPLFEAFLAELDGDVVGLASCYHTYSTWEGPTLFVLDLFVLAEHRHRGIGSLLLRRMAHEAHARGCRRLHWEVLKSNVSAIHFYQHKVGTRAPRFKYRY